MKRSVYWIIILAFLLPLGFASGELPAAASQNPGPAEIFPQPLAPREITPPEDCKVPLQGPFGKDLEVFRGGDMGLSYAFSPRWESDVYLTSPYWTKDRIRSTIGATAVNSEQIVAIWEQLGSTLLKYDIWNGDWSPWALPGTTPTYRELPALPESPAGGPVVLTTGPQRWEVYIRVGGAIQQIAWENGTVSAWAAVPGMTGAAAAASDPAVINAGPNHILLFYRDIQGAVRFTERQGGVWRETPLVLSDLTNSIYLPLVVKAMAGSSGQLKSISEGDSVSRDLSGAVLPSQLSAASRNDNHAAVFYVDGENRLWVNEWTNLNESDWSDTHWQLLMENVMIEKPAVVSRHNNHLAVTVRDTTGAAYMIEWTPDLNDTGEAGWKEPYSLGQIPYGILAGPLALASTSVENLSVFGADTTGEIWHRDWQADSLWSAWNSRFGGSDGMGAGNPEIAITTVVRRQDDIMLLYRQTSGTSDFVIYQHRTSSGAAPTETEIVPAGATEGDPRGQTQAWVDGQTLWVTAHAGAELSPEYWQVDALALGATATHGMLSLTAGNHLYTEDALVYMVAADLDFDGDDEVVVATGYTPTGLTPTISISVLKFEINPDQIGPSVSVLATDAEIDYWSA